MNEHPYSVLQNRGLSPTSDDEEDDPPKRWYHYLPLCALIFLMLAPQPSWLIILVNYHLQILHAPVTFTIHLLVSYTLTFLAGSSLIVCVARDPGPVPAEKSDEEEDDNADTSLTEALMAPVNDIHNPGNWCKKCSAPRPERTHHCSYCGRCVLKMDHHCPWIAYKCIGHRTYPAFLHFLICVNLLALYIGLVSISAIYYAFTHPMTIDETTPLHELGLGFAGITLTMVVGSFLVFHLYLVTTNQTTLENLSPFLLLRQLPSVSGTNVSGQSQEHELSYAQRRIVKRAHRYIRMYDVGWKRNWAQVFGWERKHGWVPRLLIGDGGKELADAR